MTMDTQHIGMGVTITCYNFSPAKPDTSAKSPMPIMGHHTTLDIQKGESLSAIL